MSTPSAVLVARSSRSPNNLSAALSSPTETHAAAAGIFRSSAASPPWSFEECGEEEVSELDVEEDESNTSIEVDETFTLRARYPGTVKVIVEKTTFWTHREILVFASPFFEAALSGSWSETGRPASMSSVITISRPTTHKSSDGCILENEAEVLSFAPVVDCDIQPDTDNEPKSDTGGTSISESEPESIETKREQDRVGSLAKLQGGPSTDTPPRQRAAKRHLRRGKRRSRELDAVIVLKEEKASIFQDFLKFAYPHLNCLITWKNVEGLLNISHKLVVQSLQDACSSFLLTHAAGNPVKAMRLAELYDEETIYRESSRFVLDNPEGWQDITSLSQETQLKLERKRAWFLERVLKLGLSNITRDYQCCATCPDPTQCARLLDEKWRQGYQAAMRFGACQPSILWRFMRMMEVSPPLALTHLACQTTAKNFAATLFDRMFSLGMRGTAMGTDSVTALRAGVASAAHARYFLCVTLREPERTTKGKAKARESIV